MSFNIIGLSSVVLAQGSKQHKQVVHKKIVKKKHSSTYLKKKTHSQQKHHANSMQNTNEEQVSKPEAKTVGGAVAATTAATVAAAAVAVSPSNNILSTEPEKGSVTGLPLPHFLSLRADVVNMRAGPGTRYPIIMIYHRRHMPVKVLREFDVWRLIEDVDGQKGWIQQAILSRDRFFITTGAPLSIVEDKDRPSNDTQSKTEIKKTDSVISGYVQNVQELQLSNHIVVKDAPQDNANSVAILKSGVVGSIKECPANTNWCKIKINTYIGWVPRTSFWGLLPQEIIQSH